MSLVGITGCVASGKTSVLKSISSLGYSTFSADEIVKELYLSDSVKEKVLKIFPEIEVFDKVKIAEVIYNNQKRREELENIIHPMAMERLLKFIEDTKSEKLSFAEIPLLFEKSLENLFICVIAVFCSGDLRLKRAISRGMNEETFHLINEIQMSEGEKSKRAAFVIDTTLGENKWKADVDKVISAIKRTYI